MIIVGFDPGIATLGYGVISTDKGARPEMIDYGIVSTPKDENLAVRHLSSPPSASSSIRSLIWTTGMNC